jgi:hypothetical protein
MAEWIQVSEVGSQHCLNESGEEFEAAMIGWVAFLSWKSNTDLK